jgi:hypothetical protein
MALHELRDTAAHTILHTGDFCIRGGKTCRNTGSPKDRKDWLPFSVVPPCGAPLQSPSLASDKNQLSKLLGICPGQAAFYG